MRKCRQRSKGYKLQMEGSRVPNSVFHHYLISFPLHSLTGCAILSPSFASPWSRWRIDSKEIGVNTKNWTESAQDRNYWRALVNTTSSCLVPYALEWISYWIFKFYSIYLMLGGFISLMSSNHYVKIWVFDVFNFTWVTQRWS